jgi:hypothetical protein
VARGPAAVSAAKRASERRFERADEVERVGWDTGPGGRARDNAAAAVSASEVLARGAARRGVAVGPVAGPVPGRYLGETHEALPHDVSFRFLGRGIRDFTIGGRLIARWIPVATGDGRVMVNGADIRLTWSAPRVVSGTVVRRRRGRSEILHFTAGQQFSRFAA